MAYEVGKISVYTKGGVDAPGLLAEVLAPFAAAGIDIHMVWGWSEGAQAKVMIALDAVPAATKKILAANGWAPNPGGTIHITGPNKPGVAKAVAAAIAEAKLTMEAFVAVGHGSAMCAAAQFKDAKDATKAAAAVKKLGAAKAPEKPKAPAAQAAETKLVEKKPVQKKTAKPAEKKAAPKKAAPKKAAPKKGK